MYKKLGNSIRAVYNHKGPRDKKFVEKLKKPFKIMNQNSFTPREKKDIFDVIVIVLTSILGFSALGFIIKSTIKTQLEIAEEFKKDFHNAPNVKGKGREIYEKIYKDEQDKPKEDIVKIKFPEGFGTDKQLVGIGRGTVGEGSNDYPTEKQVELLKKLDIPVKWFSKSEKKE